MENTPNKAFSTRQETRKSELTDTAVRNAKAKEKQWKLSDKKGLLVLIHPNGSKYWRMKYRYAGREKCFPWVFILQSVLT